MASRINPRLWPKREAPRLRFVQGAPLHFVGSHKGHSGLEDRSRAYTPLPTGPIAWDARK